MTPSTSQARAEQLSNTIKGPSPRTYNPRHTPQFLLHSTFDSQYAYCIHSRSTSDKNTHNKFKNVAQPSLFNSHFPCLTTLTQYSSLCEHQVFRVTVVFPQKPSLSTECIPPVISSSSDLSLTRASYFYFYFRKLGVHACNLQPTEQIQKMQRKTHTRIPRTQYLKCARLW